MTAIPNSIPADWLALGAEEGYHPKEAHELRLWVAGPTGEGKSTFTRSIPDSLTLDFGDETGGVFEPRSPRIYIKNHEHYMQVTDKLIEEGKNGGQWIKRIVFDNVDDWVNMIIEVLQKEKQCEDITEYGSKGKGWTLIRNRCWGKIQLLSEAGYVWSCTANLVEKQQTVGNNTTTVIRPVVYPSFASMFGRRADYKLVIYARPSIVTLTKPIKLPNGQVIDKPIGEETKLVYYCNCRSNDTQQAKTRGVPDMEETFELPLVDGWKTFTDKYNDARNKAIERSKELQKGSK
jgi:hypothetical protein